MMIMSFQPIVYHGNLPEHKDKYRCCANPCNKVLAVVPGWWNVSVFACHPEYVALPNYF